MFYRLPLLPILAVAATLTPLQAQLLYVGNVGDDTLSTYVIDQDSGYLTELLPRVQTPGSPNSVAIHPSGKYLYTTNSGNSNLGVNVPSLAGFTIDPKTGALRPLGTLPLPAGTSPQGGEFDAAGKFFFAAQSGPGNIAVYSIDPLTGVPTQVPGSPFAAAPGVNKVSVHPSGKFAFASVGGSGSIFAYTVAANGALAPIAGSPFAGRNNTLWMAIDPAGKFLFVVERQENALLVFSINATTGALTQVGQPYPAGPGVAGVSVDPSGKFVYAANSGNNSLTVFTLGVSGAPTQTKTYPAILGAFTPILDPSGKFLYIPGTNAGSVQASSLDSATGAPTPLNQQFFNAGQQPQRGATILLNPPVIPPISVTSVTNQFSNVLAGMPFSGIAQGSRLAINGLNIGPSVEVDAATPDIPTLPTQLGGVTVQITSGGVTTQALLVAATNSFLSAVVPSSTPTGDATVTITYKGRTTAPVPISIVAATPGIRTLNGVGTGQAKAYIAPDGTTTLSSASVQNPNNFNQSAMPGQLIVVQATGLGASTADESQPDQTPELDIPADIIVGTEVTPSLTNVRVQGADYILFQLPADAPLGCYVPLAIRVNGAISNFASLAISANGGSCSDPAGLSASDIDTAKKTGQLNMGTIVLTHTDFSPYGLNEHIDGIFERYDFNSLLQSFSPGNNSNAVRSSFSTPPTGTCTVLPGAPPSSDSPFDLLSDQTLIQPLNIGTALNVNGPATKFKLNGPSFSLGPDTSAGSQLTPGDYTADNGTGAPPIGPFKAAITMPAMLTWTNKDSITAIDRTQDLTITWSGGLADKEIAMMIGISGNQQATSGFFCTEKVSAGTFTIPAWVLSNLPASGTFTNSGFTLPNGLIGLGTTPVTAAGRFTVPGLDFGLITYEQSVVNILSYK